MEHFKAFMFTDAASLVLIDPDTSGRGRTITILAFSVSNSDGDLAPEGYVGLFGTSDGETPDTALTFAALPGGVSWSFRDSEMTTAPGEGVFLNLPSPRDYATCGHIVYRVDYAN